MEGGLKSSNNSIIKWRAEEAIAGNALALQTLRELITYPLRYARESRYLGLKWPRGLILYGPQGTGKTSLVRAMVKECNAHLTLVSSHLVSKAYIGESEKFLREAFDEAMSHARNGRPSIVFIDEIDVLCPRPDSKQNQSVRVTYQLLKLMDQNKSPAPHVVVIAATNRVDVIDPALRRYGRFSKEIEVTLPDEEGRIQILMLYTKKMPMDCGVDLQTIARSCNGYTGADLETLCFEALKSAYKNSSKTNKSHCDFTVKMEDWKQAMSVVGSSITRGVTVKIPNVTWEDIGGLKDLKKKLQQVVEWPIKRADTFKRLGIPPARGILLHGPPGCSKTTLAKAAANASQASFFSLCGAELFSKYVGEGEAKLRNTFRCARIAAPSIIFFDEADVIAAKRGGKSSNASTVGERLLSTLLTEMDGLEQTKGIIVLAATNRPHAIDEALMRPGRFDKILYVPPPDLESRLEILRVHTRGRNLAEDVDLSWIAEKTELYTGAELKFLCEEAGFVALREDISASILCHHHYETALMRKPMLTQADIEPHLSFANGQGRI